MEKLEEFKQFIKTIPSIRSDVLNGKYTWQQLYEIYCLYGKEDQLFKSYENSKVENEGLDLNKIFYIIKNIDLQALEKSLDGLQKILNIVVSMTDKSDSKNSFYKDQLR